MTSESDFQKALDLHPDDHHTRLVFADWLEERGDERAAGYRALGTGEWYPSVHLKHSTWGGMDHPAVSYSEWYMANRKWLLPKDWFRLMPYNNQTDWQDGQRPIWKRSDTRQQAEDRAALAFARLPIEHQQELLRQSVVC